MKLSDVLLLLLIGMVLALVLIKGCSSGVKVHISSKDKGFVVSDNITESGEVVVAEMDATGMDATPAEAYFPYVLEGGRHIRCRVSAQQACGVNLKDCDDGNDYYCVTNLRVPPSDN